MKEIVETLDDLAEVYEAVLRSTLYQGQEEILESIRDLYGLIQEELVGGKFQHESKEYEVANLNENFEYDVCLLYTSPSPRDRQKSRMPSSA